MKNRWLFGGAMTVWGLGCALLPNYLFTPCADDMDYAMPCLYAARTVGGLGMAAAAGGVLTMLSPRASMRRGIACMTVALAALMPWTAFVLIGICRMPTMACRMATQPAVWVLSVALGLTALAAAVWPGRDASTSTSAVPPVAPRPASDDAL